MPSTFQGNLDQCIAILEDALKELKAKVGEDEGVSITVFFNNQKLVNPEFGNMVTDARYMGHAIVVCIGQTNPAWLASRIIEDHQKGSL